LELSVEHIGAQGSFLVVAGACFFNRFICSFYIRSFSFLSFSSLSYLSVSGSFELLDMSMARAGPARIARATAATQRVFIAAACLFQSSPPMGTVSRP
jgi:hypothetical protein